MRTSIIWLITVATFCGAANFKLNDDRIVGGSFAEKNQFPHQIAIIFRERLRCGGSIIKHNWVITAAHCVTDGFGGTVDGLSVLAGTNSLSDGGVSRKVIASYYHEKYGNFTNDIALMKLETSLVFSEAIGAISLAIEEIPLGSDVIISGWGREGTWGSTTDRLKFNSLKLVDRKNCAFDYEGLLCLGHSEGNGACNGDSGGSALYHDKLVGVANFVKSGCGSKYPDGYAKVSYFVDWINKKIADNEEKNIEDMRF